MKKTMKYYGFYRGQVMQCLNNGFCRIRVPNILECTDKKGEEINTLPLAEPAQPIGGGSTTTLSGTFTYPDKNSIVWVFFEGGNLERPVYFASSNVRSPNWDSVLLAEKVNTNKGNTGKSIEPIGHLIKFNKSSIKQSAVLDKTTERPIGDKIDIVVNSTSEMEKEYAKTTEENKEKTKGFTAPNAASIHLDNKWNTVTITAKNSIVLRAPNILFDTTGFERPGYILINSNVIDNLLNNGNYRIMQGLVNIDGGSQDIILQTMGEIHRNKVTEPPTTQKITYQDEQ